MSTAFEFLPPDQWTYGLWEVSHHGEHDSFPGGEPSEGDV